MSSNCRETAEYNSTWGCADYKLANITHTSTVANTVLKSLLCRKQLVHYFKKYLEGLGSTFMLEPFLSHD